MVGQRYYFDAQRITIPGETERQRSFSNFRGLQWPRGSQYLCRCGVGIRLPPQSESTLFAGWALSTRSGEGPQRRIQNHPDALGVSQIKQIDIAGNGLSMPVGMRLAATTTSLRDKQALETIAGVEYNAGCWAARFVVQRLEAVAGSPNTTVFFPARTQRFRERGLQSHRPSAPDRFRLQQVERTAHLKAISLPIEAMSIRLLRELLTLLAFAVLGLTSAAAVEPFGGGSHRRGGR